MSGEAWTQNHLGPTARPFTIDVHDVVYCNKPIVPSSNTGPLALERLFIPIPTRLAWARQTDGPSALPYFAKTRLLYEREVDP